MPRKREGSRYWEITIAGVRRSSRTEDFAAAKAIEDAGNLEAWKQRHLGAKPKRSWQDAVVRWAKERASKKSLGNDLEYFKWWHPFIGHIEDLNLITRELIDEIVQKHRPVDIVKAVPGNTTANKYVSAVSGVLSAAEREWSWGNTAPRLRFYDEPPSNDVCPTPEQVRALIAELPIHSADIALFAVSSMYRRANITGLTWAMVSFDMEAVKVPGVLTKTGQPIYTPLNQTAMQVLRERRASPGKDARLVFHYKGEPVHDVTTAAWHKARVRAGIQENVTLHTMRHCANSWLAQRGVPKEIRAQLGGWSLGKQAIDGYTHLFIDHLRPFVAMLDAILAGPVHTFDTTTRNSAGPASQVLEVTGVADGIRTHNNQNHKRIIGKHLLH